MVFLGRLISEVFGCAQMVALLWAEVVPLRTSPLSHLLTGSINAWLRVIRCIRMVNQYSQHRFCANRDIIDCYICGEVIVGVSQIFKSNIVSDLRLALCAKVIQPTDFLKIADYARSIMVGY